jgi:hypothetical protein
MKKAVLCVVLGMVVVGGCVPTLHELYTKQTAIFDGNLVGTWAEPNKQETWKVSRTEPNGNAYSILYTEKKGKTADLAGHLVKVDNALFLDLELADFDTTGSELAKVFLAPVHYIIKLEPMGAKIAFGQISQKGLKAMLDNNPNVIKYEVVNGAIVITASQEELQKFLKTYAGDKAIFPQDGILEKK